MKMYKLITVISTLFVSSVILINSTFACSLFIPTSKIELDLIANIIEYKNKCIDSKCELFLKRAEDALYEDSFNITYNGQELVLISNYYNDYSVIFYPLKIKDYEDIDNLIQSINFLTIIDLDESRLKELIHNLDKIQPESSFGGSYFTIYDITEFKNEYFYTDECHDLYFDVYDDYYIKYAEDRGICKSGTDSDGCPGYIYNGIEFVDDGKIFLNDQRTDKSNTLNIPDYVKESELTINIFGNSYLLGAITERLLIFILFGIVLISISIFIIIKSRKR